MPISTQELSAAEREVLGNVADWARQTIAFAISVRHTATSSSVDDAEMARLTGKEADRLTDELWSEVASECDFIPEAVITYAKKVFDWSYKHIHREEASHEG